MNNRFSWPTMWSQHWKRNFNFLMVANDTHPSGTLPHVIVGCHMMSDKPMREIKFDTTMMTKLIDWLKTEKIFIESDSLGITCTTTIGYLTQLHPKLTNCMFLKPLLLEHLEEVVIDPSLACELDPSLTALQTEAMSNGDMFIPAPPPFEIYQTRITCRKDKDKIKMDIIGIKCASNKSCLLKEFFNQSGLSQDADPHAGKFVPAGAIHLIGLEAYTKLLCNHNHFLHTVTTVPIRDFQHVTLDIPFSMDANTDIEQTNLTKLILSQPWCISLE